MLKRFGGIIGPLVGLLAICIALSIMSADFLTIGNLSNVVKQVSVNAILASGATLVILLGGIDLSVGSLLALAGAVSARILLNAGIPECIAAGLIVGIVFGIFNGVIISYGNVAPFIVTLGTMTILRSLTLVYTGGKPISNYPDAFLNIGEGSIFHIPVPMLIAVLVLVSCHLMLKRTRFGRYIYAIGGNEDATRLSGINVRLMKTLVYTFAGVLTSIGAIVFIARLDSAQPQAGAGFELDAIAAVVIGGTSLSGGSGGIPGTILGALIMGVMRNGLNLMEVSAFWQQAFIGSVIIVAVLADQLRKRRA
ncbi:MAG TPA: ribose ABC transporter permease [bacterium]|nr:ribose ABC transporter permease [bacterium]